MLYRRPLWDFDEEVGLTVLVPGLMGLGFLISLVMLVADGIGRILPRSGRRRAVAIASLSPARVSDVIAVVTGSPPTPRAVTRVPRPRIQALTLAVIAGAGAVVAVVVGIEGAAEVGVDRQAWVLGFGVFVAAILAGLAVLWLGTVVTGRSAPRWLRRLHNSWPLGTLRSVGSVGEKE